MAQKRSSKNIQDVENAMRRKAPAAQILTRKDFLSTSATTLNLACSGRSTGGIGKGHYVLWVGDSSSGKTMFAMSLFAEACRNREFDGYDLIYDASENGMLMNVEKFFGPEAAKRIILPPRGVSSTIEEMYYTLKSLQRRGKPFIFVEDSLDALDSDQAEKKVDEQMKAHDEGTESKGSMTDGKAKKHSEMLRGIVNKLKNSGSILVLLSQTRDNIDPKSWETKTRAGGRALRFYSHVELWSSTTEKLKKTVRGKPRVVGIRVRIQVRKNRYEGWEGALDNILIYRSYGIDDIGSCIDYLIEENEWSDSKGKVTATDFDFVGSREKLIQKIETEGLDRQLRILTSRVWKDIEEKSRLQRKPKYGTSEIPKPK